VDRGSAARFDRFNAFRSQHTGGRELPVELYVVLQRDGPARISVWTVPTKRVEATLVGYLTDVALPEFEAALDRMAPDQTPMAMFTANREGPGQYVAVVEGLPLDWSIPDTDTEPAE
jgi:hypothetical protein